MLRDAYLRRHELRDYDAIHIRRFLPNKCNDSRSAFVRRHVQRVLEGLYDYRWSSRRTTAARASVEGFGHLKLGDRLSRLS